MVVLPKAHSLLEMADKLLGHYKMQFSTMKGRGRLEEGRPISDGGAGKDFVEI